MDMAEYQDVTRDIINYAKQADEYLTRLITLERAANSKQPHTDKQIISLLQETDTSLQRAKVAIEYLQNEIRKKEPDNLDALKALEKKLDHIHLQSERLQNIRLRVMSRIKPNQLDPDYQMLLSSPKAPTFDPAEGLLASAPKAVTTDPKIGLLAKDALDEITAATRENPDLSKNEKRAIVKKFLDQLPDANEKLAFSKIIQEEVKQRNLEVLNQIHAPTKLPKYTNSVKSAEQKPIEIIKSDFEKEVERIAKLPFKDAKVELQKINDPEERWKYIVAVRQEVENNKLKEAFEKAKVPTDNVIPHTRKPS